MPGPNPHQLSSASPRMPCEPASSRQMRHCAHHLHSNLAPMGRTQRIYGFLSYIPTAVGIQSQGTHILSHILHKSARVRRRNPPQAGSCPRASPLAAQWGHCAIPTCVCRNCWPSKFLRKEIIFCQHLDRPHTPTNFLSFLLSVDINRHNISFSHENTFGKTLH